MEKQACKSCCATKGVEELDGFQTCNKLREAKRKCYKKNQKEYNQARREERAKGSQFMQRMRTQNKTRKLGCPFPLCVTSELGTKYIDERLLNKVR